MITERVADTTARSILWLEDHWSEGMPVFPLHVRFLEAEGFSVRRVKTIDQWRSNKTFHDVYIVDYRLQGSENGEQFIREVAAENSSGAFVFFSSFISDDGLKAVAESLRTECGISVGLIGKEEVPTSATELKSQFIDRIVQIDDDAQNTSQIAEGPHEPRDHSQSLTWSDYLSLDTESKLDLLDGFYSENREHIEKEFRSGAVWLMYMQGSTQPVIRAMSEDEIPTKEQQNEICRKHNRAPLKIRGPRRMEGILTAEMFSNDQIQTYPHLEMEIGGQKRKMHFDTGSFGTYLNADFYKEFINLDLSEPELLPTNLGQVFGVGANINALVDVGDDGSSTRKLSFEAWATLRWEKSPLSINCEGICTAECSQGSICYHRKFGLAGRSTYASAGLSFKLTDGGTLIKFMGLKE